MVTWTSPQPANLLPNQRKDPRTGKIITTVQNKYTGTPVSGVSGVTTDNADKIQNLFLTDLGMAAQNAYQQTPKTPYTGSTYAPPTGAQTQANQQALDWSAANQNLGAPAAAATGNLQQAMNTVTANMGAPTLTPERVTGALPYQTPGMAGFDMNDPAMQQFWDSLSNFNPQAYGTAPGFNYQTNTNPGTSAAFNTSLNSIAGGAPVLGDDTDFNAAMQAAMGPMQRYLEEVIIPQTKLQGTEAGNYGGDATSINMATNIRDQFAKPLSETLANMSFQNLARKEGIEKDIYQQRLGIGAEASGSYFDRILQDMLAQNQLGFADTQSLRDYGAQNTEMMNQLEMAKASGLTESELARSGMLNQYGMADTAGQREFALNAANQANSFGLSERGLQQQETTAANAFNLDANQQMQDYLIKALTSTTVGASTMPGLIQSGAQLDLLPSQIASSAGAQQQGWNQAEMDAALQQWQMAQMTPWIGLDPYAQILQGSGGFGNTPEAPEQQSGGLAGGLTGAIGGGLTASTLMSSGILGPALAANPALWPVLIGAGLGGLVGAL